MIVTFLGRRLATFVLLTLGVTLIAFVLTHLDRPQPGQYPAYLATLLRGDLGESDQTRRPVGADIAADLPATLELALTSLVLSGLLGTSLGALGALRHHNRTDRVLHVISLAGLSMPAYWLSIVGLWIFASYLTWLPGGDRLGPGVPPPPSITGLYTLDALFSARLDTFADAVQHLILPACVLATFNLGLFLRFTRTALLDVLGSGYVRAARAKGVPERLIVVNYVLRSVAPPVISVIGLAFGNVIAGAVLVENIFAWPGLGQYAFRSAAALDLTASVGVLLVVASTCILVTTLVDVLRAAIDPRLRPA